jgi:transposase InsO family protein
MRDNGLNAKGGRKFIPTADSNRSLPVCENILNRDVSAAGPGGKRVSDITYLRTPGNRLYLTAVTDLFDRKVIGWPFSTDMTAERTAVSAPVMARVNRRPRDGLIFHSVRGARPRSGQN